MFTSTWEQERENRYKFRLVCNTTMKNLCKVYPINQRYINRIYDAVHNDLRIDTIIIYGSSLNFRCNFNSDIDLAIKLKPKYVSNKDKDDISYKIQSACDWRADILWRDQISDQEEILEEIRSGVILE